MKLNYEKVAGIFAALCLIMAIFIIVALRKLDDQRDALNSMKAYIEFMDQDQNKWCPHQFQGFSLTNSIWRDEYRGLNTGMLVCFYRKQGVM